jgi:hypothetical protein
MIGKLVVGAFVEPLQKAGITCFDAARLAMNWVVRAWTELVGQVARKDCGGSSRSPAKIPSSFCRRWALRQICRSSFKRRSRSHHGAPGFFLFLFLIFVDLQVSCSCEMKRTDQPTSAGWQMVPARGHVKAGVAVAWTGSAPCGALYAVVR